MIKQSMRNDPVELAVFLGNSKHVRVLVPNPPPEVQTLVVHVLAALSSLTWLIRYKMRCVPWIMVSHRCFIFLIPL